MLATNHTQHFTSYLAAFLYYQIEILEIMQVN